MMGSPSCCLPACPAPPPRVISRDVRNERPPSPSIHIHPHTSPHPYTHTPSTPTHTSPSPIHTHPHPHTDMRGYDAHPSMFAPSGRIPQVEYAREVSKWCGVVSCRAVPCRAVSSFFVGGLTCVCECARARVCVGGGRGDESVGRSVDHQVIPIPPPPFFPSSPYPIPPPHSLLTHITNPPPRFPNPPPLAKKQTRR